MSVQQKTVKIDISTHTELAKIGRKSETFNNVIQRLINGHNSRNEAIGNIRALAGRARSCHAGNTEMTEEIKKLENDAINLLEVG